MSVRFRARLLSPVQLLCILWLSAVAGCGGGRPAPRPTRPAESGGRAPRPVPKAVPAAPVEALHYVVTVDPALSQLDVRLCFEGRPPRRLVAGFREMASLMDHLTVDGPAGRRSIHGSGRRIDLPALGRDDCLAYRIALHPGRGFQPAARRAGDAMLVDSRAWMWRPARWDGATRVSARFILPAGFDASLPWPQGPRGGHGAGVVFEADSSALRFPALGLVGRFERVPREQVAGAALSVVVMPGLSGRTRGELLPFLRASMRASAGALGHFPAPAVQVVVLPRPSGSAVGFGMLQRGGGASVLLLVAPEADLTTAEAAWTPVHEFSHLLHPFVSKPDAWLSEGLATYYQEVLRARAGLISPRRAWQRIYDGARHCRGVGATLSQATAAMRRTGNYARVYWAGAVAALRADVALRRRRGGGPGSLDQAVAGLHGCCARSARAWAGEAVLQRLDDLAGAPVFRALGDTAESESTARMADLGALYAELGIELDGGRVRLGRGPLAEVRDAIMAAVPPPAGSQSPVARGNAQRPDRP